MEELWNGFVLQKGTFDGKNTIVVLPKEGTANGRLAVKTEYWGAFPEAVEIDLLKEGFHLCYIENDNRWGTDVDLVMQLRLMKEKGLRKYYVLWECSRYLK